MPSRALACGALRAEALVQARPALGFVPLLRLPRDSSTNGGFIACARTVQHDAATRACERSCAMTEIF